MLRYRYQLRKKDLLENLFLSAKEIERILDVVYSEIKNTPVIKQINAALVEASKKLINIRHEKISKQNVKKYTQIIEEVQGLIKYIDNGAIIEGIRKRKREVGKKIAGSTVKEELDMKVSSNMITCRYKSSNHNNVEPEWNPKRDSLEIPIRESMIIKPNEIKIVDLGFEIETTTDLEKRIGLAEGFTNTVRYAHKNLPPTTPIDLELTFSSHSLEIKLL